MGLTGARARVPCSTSNLGAGFDCIGLALDRYLEAEFLPHPDGLTLERGGTLARLDVDADADLLVRAFRNRLERAGVRSPTGRLVAESQIPLSRGLGSSASAIVAGLALASTALGQPFRVDDALAHGLEFEPHPDNLAPTLLGGLVAALPVDGAQGDLRLVRLALSPALGFAIAAPATMIATSSARAALPASVAHDIAVRSLARTLSLVRGLAEADRDLIRAGFQDELHVPYRLPLVPHAAEAIAAARDAGAWAVTMSGAGSALIAVAGVEQAAPIASAMCDAFGGEAEGAFGIRALPDQVGATMHAYDPADPAPNARIRNDG